MAARSSKTNVWGKKDCEASRVMANVGRILKETDLCSKSSTVTQLKSETES